jgi:hypothetical protein
MQVLQLRTKVDAAGPPGSGLSNKRIRSRLRAIYPYSLG